MPTSVRVIRVVNNEYTVEVETEVEDIKDIFEELNKTAWGRKVAYLLSEMLPDIPEYQAPSVKEEAEAEEKRIKEHEQKLREEGASEKVKELIDKYGDFEKIKENAEKAVRERYLSYIRREQGREKPIKRPRCFGTYDMMDDDDSGHGYNEAMMMLAKRMRCRKCKCRRACENATKKKKSA